MGRGPKIFLVVFALCVAAAAATQIFTSAWAPHEAPRGPPAPVPDGRVVLVIGPDGEPVAHLDAELWVRRPHRFEPESLGRAFIVDSRAILPEVPRGEGDVVLALGSRTTARTTFPVDGLGDTVQLGAPHRFRGFVLDLEGRPIAGARVLHPPLAPHTSEAVTGADGAFAIEGVPEDAWLRAEGEGYASVELSLLLYPPGDPCVIFYLVREKLVSGQVVDSAGRGVPGAVVALDQEVVSRTVADAEGRFVLRGALSDWEVLVTPHAEGMIGATVQTDVGRSDLRLTLFRPATVEGRVVDGTLSAAVTEFDLVGPEGEKTADGGFRITGLLPGPVEVRVEAGSLKGRLGLELAEGENLKGAVIPVLPPRWGPAYDYRIAHEVRIRALDAETGAPVEGALVRESGTSRRTRTDATGLAVIRFPAGRCAVRIGGAFEPYDVAEREFFVPETDALEVRLDPNPEVVLDLLDVRPRIGSKVWLHRSGEYVEQAVRSAEHRFHASRDLPIDILLRVKRFLPNLLSGTEIPDDGRIPVRLFTGALVTGRCLGGAGHPLMKVVVEIEEDPTELRMETGGDGRFRVGPVEPGRYRLLVYARNVRARTWELEVAEEGVDLGDIPMLPPAALHVLVTNSANEPVAGALVETSILVPSKGVTDTGGRIVLPGTNAEEVLRVHADGYLDGWKEVSVPDDADRVETLVRLHRPARLVVRAVDRGGSPVFVIPPPDLDTKGIRPGEFTLLNLPPGPIEIPLEDRDGRKGRLRTIVVEGESRVVEVVLE